MTATAVATVITQRINDAFSSGRVTLTPPTAWCSWFNNYGLLVIVVFRDRNPTVMNRNQFDEMTIVFEAEYGLRVGAVQSRGVFVWETFYTENDGNDELQVILDENFDNDDIRR